MSATDTRGRFLNTINEVIVDVMGENAGLVVSVYDGIAAVADGQTFVSVDAYATLSRDDAARLRDALTAAVAFIDEGQPSG